MVCNKEINITSNNYHHAATFRLPSTEPGAQAPGAIVKREHLSDSPKRCPRRRGVAQRPANPAVWLRHPLIRQAQEKALFFVYFLLGLKKKVRRLQHAQRRSATNITKYNYHNITQDAA